MIDQPSIHLDHAGISTNSMTKGAAQSVLLQFDFEMMNIMKMS